MGSSRWSDKEYTDRGAHRAATGKKMFEYDDDVRTGRTARVVHEKLNPFGVKMRESRDSDAHPESLAIAVFFDVTGSMRTLPGQIQAKLAGLMNLLISKGYVAHPQILFGCNGDAYVDFAPLQVGQFESGIEMEDDLSRFILEGGGGGGARETYELTHYFIARHTSIDCFEKRGKKGYFFTIGDENYYPKVVKEHVKKLIGDTLQDDISTADIVKELQERYHVFHIIAEQGGYPHDKVIEQSWEEILGQNVLKLEDTNLVAELIATTIGLNEETVSMDTAKTNLADVGVNASGIDALTRSLSTVVLGGAMSKVGTGSGVAAGVSGLETV